MRPYRGLTKDGKWVEGWYCKNPYNKHDIIIGIDDWFPYEVLPESVAQQVGLKDKDGKESWHHDLFIHDVRNGGKPIEIVWEDGSYKGRYVLSEGIGEHDFAFVLNDREMSQAVIIGNITENPELLK